MILLMDNYDSFVYNLARYVSRLGHAIQVVRNDAISLDEMAALNPSHLILSPGPCTPNEAGVCLAAIERFAGSFPILGVCLGHQAIGQVFGGSIVRAREPLHGKSSSIVHCGEDLFEGLSTPFTVGRYHSLVVSEDNFPQTLQITARSESGEIMALKHKTLPVYGVQFHPESVLTPQGHLLVEKFLKNSSPPQKEEAKFLLN